MLGGRQRVAQAQLTLNVSQFQRSAQAAIATSQTLRNAVQKNFQAVNTSLNQAAASGISKVAQGFREATRAADEFGRTDLGRVASGLSDVEKQLRGVSLAAGVVSALGIKEAQNLLRQNALLKVFSRTQENLVSNQDQIRKFAEATSQSYLTTLESANAILPTVNRYKIDLGGVLSIIQRLAILDPAQGIQGAAFALREALSGQGRSLAARFELPLSQVNGIIKAGAGDPDKIIAGLGQLVDNLGLTNEAFLELQNSGVNAFERLKGTVREALGTAFTPFLTQVLIPLADKFNELVSTMTRVNPGLLSMAAAGTLLVAALTPVLFIGSKLITMFGTLATFFATGTGAGILAALKGFAVGAAGAVASVGGGVLAGAGVAQLAANSGARSGDLGRIADGENVFKVLWERIRQLMVITITSLATAIAGIIAAFKKAGAYIEFALNNLGVVLQLGGSLVAEAFGTLVQKVGELIVGVGVMLHRLPGFDTAAPGVADTVMTAGGNIAVSGWELVQGVQERRAELEAELNNIAGLNSKLSAIDQEMISFINHFTRGLITAAGMGDVLTGTIDDVVKPVSALSQIMTTVGEATQGFATALGTALPVLLDGQAKANEMRDEFTLTRQRQLQSRGVEDQRTRFDDGLADYRKVTEFRKSMARDDEDFYDSQWHKARDFQTELSDTEQDNYLKRAELNKEYAQTEVEQAEDQGRKLARIQRETMENVQKAARKLDASGVSEAYRNGRKQIDELSEQAEVERKQRQKDYAEKVAEFDAQSKLERDRRIRDFETARADELEQYQVKRYDRIQAFQQELQDEAYDRAIRDQRKREDRAREDQIAVEDYNRRIAALWKTVYTESMLWSNLRDVVSGASAGIRAAIASIFNQPAPQTISRGTGSGGGGSSGVQGRVFTPFAMGGTPPLNQPVLVGERGVEVVQFTSPAKIHSSESSATRGVLNGRGGASLQIGTFAPVFGIPNLDSVALELHQRIEDTITQFALEYAARG